jgi:hypothetical protein
VNLGTLYAQSQCRDHHAKDGEEEGPCWNNSAADLIYLFNKVPSSSSGRYLSLLTMTSRSHLGALDVREGKVVME